MLNYFNVFTKKKMSNYITAHSWHNGHFVNINVCRMWEIMTKVQVSKNEIKNNNNSKLSHLLTQKY